MGSDPNPRVRFVAPAGPWQDWFAWRPVRTHDDRRVWLRWCRRRLCAHTLVVLGSREPSLLWQYHLTTRAALANGDGG